MANSKLLGLHVSPSSGTPIYRQIMDQIQRLVASKSLAIGDELPSVRILAEQHAINPMTVSKAYSALEVQGVLTRLRGKGMVVAKNKDSQLDLSQRLAQLDSTLEMLSLEAGQLNISDEQMMSYIEKFLKFHARKN
ncbi:MAG: GntR family transcriptional regulator [Proteobacteria bacterium]|nr:GntR family transcriptional regulator [Pseudomonadota bacterium]